MRRFVVNSLFFLTACMLAASLPSRARAEDRPERPQIAAATSEAVTSLREQIEREPINRNVTVGEFLRRTGGGEELSRALARAELVGGPRWVDADTCQVQLEMSGPRVARILEQIATREAKKSPVSADEVAKLAAEWHRHTFSGSGSSTAFGRVAKARPQLLGTGWANVPDAEREKALSAAKADAISRVIDSIKPIPIARGKTVGDALANADVRAALVDWLENRPVTRVDYRRDLRVELAMAGTPGGCFDVVRRAVTKNTDFPIPRDEAGWSAVREDFEKRMATPIGRASVASTPGSAIGANPRPSLLPVTAPDWADRRIEAEAVANVDGLKLKSAREAENIARRKLATEIGALPLSKDMTISKAAEQDPRVRTAISQALDKARVKTDYDNKKGVAVVMHLDLRELWDALQAGR